MKKETPIIVAQNLVKNYGQLRAVDDVSLQLFRGEVLGLLGPNGAGKTTTINIICGLLKPNKGKVLINNEPISSASDKTYAMIGICPQDLVFWEYLTCEEQLIFTAEMYGLSRKTARQNAWRLLERLNLTDKAKKTGRTLSGGLKRRLNIALAMVHGPEIVVLDEPEAGLDPQSRIMVREYIQEITRSRTVIFTTHNMDEAERVCERVAIIDNGQLLVVDTPENLKKNIGKGDVIELITREKIDKKALEKEFRKHLGGHFKKLILFDGRLILRVMDSANLIPKIMQVLDENRIKTEETHLRLSTLEDVFIELTGRGLRE